MPVRRSSLAESFCIPVAAEVLDPRALLCIPPANSSFLEGLAMQLRNLLTSFAWNSLLGRSGRRLRRPCPVATPISPAAEFLECRQLLSNANVNLNVVAGAITLTATDRGVHFVDVSRADSTNVAFSPGVGTQITYLGVAHTSAFNVAIPSVASVKVNLGTGGDVYDIDNLSTQGNITFQGNRAGGLGASVEVTSEQADMVVGGSVIFNVGKQTSGSSFQEILVDNSGNLTINGSVQVNESGPVFSETELTTEQTGNLLVKGSVSINQSGSGQKDILINRSDTGTVDIQGAMKLSDAGTGTSSTEIDAVTVDGTAKVKMLGAGSQISVNKSVEPAPTTFQRAVSISMRGPGAKIALSNPSQAGTPVAFISSLKVVGKSGNPAGTLFLDGPVHFASPPTLTNFAEVG
jgi:hypothetical protein